MQRHDDSNAGRLPISTANLDTMKNVDSIELITEVGPRLGLYPPLESLPVNHDLTLSAAGSLRSVPQTPEELNTEPRYPEIDDRNEILIVDDNAINRRLLSAFMKKRKIPYREAHDGLQALESFREANGVFKVILMGMLTPMKPWVNEANTREDISMPIMDGMTSTRLIREHEINNDLLPAHIIALTGLTSASAKLEAWSSGVDDFLTKPVDFKKLEGLMNTGRSCEGSGFFKE